MERATTIDEGRLIGVLNRPASAASRPTLVILNAGLVYRVGPGRLSVDLARWAAELGFSSFRFDWSGLGDSKPRIPPLGGVESAIADATDAMNHLTAEFGLRSFILVGLCSGAVFGHHVTATDPRVVGAVFLDGYVFPTLRSRLGEATQRLRQPLRLAQSALRRVLRFRSPPAPAGRTVSERDALLPLWPGRSVVEADLRRMHERDVELFFVFSGEWFRYRYEGQMREAFRSVDLGKRLAELRIEGAEHLYFTRPERDRLRRALLDWLEGRFPPAGRPSS